MKFDPAQLARLLEENCPRVIFALLHGSAAAGEVKPGSDLDLALYIDGPPDWRLYNGVMAQAEQAAPGIRCDVGILNDGEPVYRFEALKGKLLFTRDQEAYLRFFSLTCREYEEQMASYERQRCYLLNR